MLKNQKRSQSSSEYTDCLFHHVLAPLSCCYNLDFIPFNRPTAPKIPDGEKVDFDVSGHVTAYTLMVHYGVGTIGKMSRRLGKCQNNAFLSFKVCHGVNLVWLTCKHYMPCYQHLIQLKIILCVCNSVHILTLPILATGIGNQACIVNCI